MLFRPSLRIFCSLLPSISAVALQAFPFLFAEEPIRPGTTIDLLSDRGGTHFYNWLVDDHYSDPKGVFSFVDAVDGAPALRISGERWGGLATRRSYRDYRLVAEFRWGLLTWGDRTAAARDSGILLHCQGRDGNTAADFNGPWMSSFETQIIEGGTGDFIFVAGYGEEGARVRPTATAYCSQDRDGEWVYDPWGEAKEFSQGRLNWHFRDPDWMDRLGFRGWRDLESPATDWTRIEVVCNGGAILNFVNGRLVNRLQNASWTEGKIMIQSEGAEIYFRKLELQPLQP